MGDYLAVIEDLRNCDAHLLATRNAIGHSAGAVAVSWACSDRGFGQHRDGSAARGGRAFHVHYTLGAAGHLDFSN